MEQSAEPDGSTTLLQQDVALFPAAVCLPDGVDLTPVRITDAPVFERALRTLRAPISDYTFAGVYLWSASLRMWWTVINDHLCLFANGLGDLTMLMPPMPMNGRDPERYREVLDRCFEVMDAYNTVYCTTRHSRIEYVSAEMLDLIGAATGDSMWSAAMWGDYVYDTARMIDLAGGDLKSKRGARSRFMREVPNHRVEDLRPEHAPACLDLLDTWVRCGDSTHEGEVNDSHVGTDILRHMEQNACRRALACFQSLGLRGMVLLAGDQIIGFTLGQRLTETMFQVVIEKTDPMYDGAAQFIFSEFCRRCWSEYPECNVGDDWGIPSLRFTKQTYRPKRMLEKFVIAREPVSTTLGLDGLQIPLLNPPFVASATAAGPALEPVMADETIDLRDAVEADLAGVLAAEEVAFEYSGDRFNKRQIRSLIRNPKALVVVAATPEGRILGWAAGIQRQHRLWRSGRLYSLAVHPDARGRRLGERLAKAVLERFSAQGITRCFLEVREGNEAARNLYTKLGFRAIAHLLDYYGPGVNGIRMRLVTPQPGTAPLFEGGVTGSESA